MPQEIWTDVDNPEYVRSLIMDQLMHQRNENISEQNILMEMDRNSILHVQRNTSSFNVAWTGIHSFKKRGFVCL